MTLTPFDFRGFLMPKGTTPPPDAKYVYDPQTGEVGRGGHGVAILAELATNPATKVVVKAIFPQASICPSAEERERHLEAHRKEVRVLHAMEQFGGVKIVEHKDRPEPPAMYIVLEQCDGGSLGDQIHYRRAEARDFRLNEIGVTLTQVLLSLYSMHRVLKVLHRDIKPENIFTCSSGEVKLGDFGLSKQCDVTVEGRVANTTCGTPSYMAPEVLARGKYGAAADVWSLGVVAYRMMTFSLPSQLQRNDHMDVLRHLEALSDEGWADAIRTGLAQRIDIDDSLDIRDTIVWMLQKAPERRPACSALLRTPFFNWFVTHTRQQFVEKGNAERVAQIDRIMLHWSHNGYNLPVTKPPAKPWQSTSPDEDDIVPTFAPIADRPIDRRVSYSGRVHHLKGNGATKERFLRLVNGELVLYRHAAPEGESRRISVGQIEFCLEAFEPDQPTFQLMMLDDSDYCFATEDWQEWIRHIELAMGTVQSQPAEAPNPSASLPSEE